MSLDSFSYLWDGSEEGWTLVRSDRVPQPTIYNRVDRSALIIEDDELYADVVQKMIEQGAEILDSSAVRATNGN
jgi:hypothetical protein